MQPPQLWTFRSGSCGLFAEHYRFKSHGYGYRRGLIYLQRSGELARRNAYDGEFRGADFDLLTDDISAAPEALFPEPMADYCYRRCADLVISFVEGSPKQRPHSQSIVVAAGHRLNFDHFSLIVGDYCLLEEGSKCKEGGQRTLRVSHPLGPEFLEGIEAKHRRAAPARRLSGEDAAHTSGSEVPAGFPLKEDEALRLFDGQHLRETRTARANRCGVGSDPQRQQKHRYESESLVLEQHSQAVPQVMKHLVLRSRWVGFLRLTTTNSRNGFNYLPVRNGSHWIRHGRRESCTPGLTAGRSLTLVVFELNSRPGNAKSA